MTESETEAETETLERLEAALRRIADLAQPRRGATAVDREALIDSLDLLINRLKAGLKPAHPVSE